MTQEQIEQLQSAVKEAIEKNVNVKIDKLHSKLDNYIADDTEWKQKAQPVIQMGENVAGFGKVSLYIVGFVAAVSGAIISVMKLIRDN